MPTFKCPRCGYSTDHKGHLKSHLKKKKACSPIYIDVTREYILDQLETLMNSEFVNKMNNFDDKIRRDSSQFNCKFCNKSFKHATSMYKHQRSTCKKREQLIQKEQEKDEKIDELKNQVHDLLQMLMESSVNSSLVANNNSHNTITNNITNNTTNNNTTNNTQLQINNQINNYGSENTSYITKEQYKEILKNPFTGLSKLIDFVHFNDDHPENKNLRIPNKKQPYIEYYDNGWVIGNRYKFVCKMFFVKKEALHQAYLEVEDVLDEKTKEAYRFFREETTLNPKTVESQLKDIQAAIMSGTRKRKEYLNTNTSDNPIVAS
jgi:hypothetical protein